MAADLYFTRNNINTVTNIGTVHNTPRGLFWKELHH